MLGRNSTENNDELNAFDDEGEERLSKMVVLSSYENEESSYTKKELLKRRSIIIFISSVFCFFMGILVYRLFISASSPDFQESQEHRPDDGITVTNNAFVSTTTTSNYIILESCPSNENDEFVTNEQTEALDSYFDDYKKVDQRFYNKTINEIKKMSMDPYDGSLSYLKLKDTVRLLKESAFLPYIQSGNLIYESACGKGFNMLLTAEILYEYNITNLTFFGNEYVSERVALANRIWDDEDVKKIVSKGNICHGDSTHLSKFVPSNTFDLVFTGYIDPLLNPMHYYNEIASGKEEAKDGEDSTEVDLASWKYSLDLCNSNIDMARQEQRRQEEWYDMWINNMVRIAKPGKMIIMENNAESLCNSGDWGGVDKSWWNNRDITTPTSHWRDYIDVSSIQIFEGSRVGAVSDNRYHVAMRKKDT